MSVMEWIYLAIAAAGFLGGVGVSWGMNRTETSTTRRDLDRLRGDFKEFQKEVRADIQKLLILRIKNGGNGGAKGPDDLP